MAVLKIVCPSLMPRYGYICLRAAPLSWSGPGVNMGPLPFALTVNIYLWSIKLCLKITTYLFMISLIQNNILIKLVSNKHKVENT